MQFFLLEIAQFGEQVEKNPKEQKAAQAISKGNQQFAQEVSVQQPHSGGSVASATFAGKPTEMTNDEMVVKYCSTCYLTGGRLFRVSQSLMKSRATKIHLGVLDLINTGALA